LTVMDHIGRVLDATATDNVSEIVPKTI